MKMKSRLLGRWKGKGKGGRRRGKEKAIERVNMSIIHYRLCMEMPR
jgi:hypothetical protein